MYNRIVLTLDGSALSRCALPHAAAMARAFGVKLVLLRVIPYPDVVDASHEVDYRAAARQDMEAIAGDLRAQGVDVEIQILWGEVVRKIVEAVEEEPETLLVMSSHGRTGLTKLAFGSVTESVLREARSTPSLVCRCPHDEGAAA
jgi:universal stress protein A